MDVFRRTRESDRALAGVLADIAHELSSPVDWRARLTNVLGLLCEIVACDVSALGVTFDGWHVLYSPSDGSQFELSPTLFQHMTMLTGEQPAADGQAVDEVPQIISEVSGETGSFLSLPVVGAGQVLGVLHVSTDESGAYTPEDASILSVVAQQIGSYIKNEQARVEEARVREQIERLSAESERRAAELESFISSMADGVIVLDSEGEVALINESGRRLLGLAENEPVRWWDYSRYDLSGSPIAFQEIASYRALQGETVKDTRYTMVTPRGDHLVISTSASPIRGRNGEVVGASVVFRDQGDRVAHEKGRQELLEREHNIAQVLQKALMPESIPEVAGLKIAARYEPSMKEAEVGGDFYDVFDMGDGKTGILIGDVAGKGLSAAIKVAEARHSIRSYGFLDSSPSTVLTLANDALSRDRFDDIGMITVLLAVVDTVAGTVTCANGGHEPPFIRRQDGTVELLDVAGRALGVTGGYAYTEEIWSLQSGDTVVLVTDGITEARVGSGQLFGTDGVVRYLAEARWFSPDLLAAELLDEARSFAGGQLKDDAAIVVFRFEGKREGPVQ